MVIARKPKTTKVVSIDVDALINMGGSVAQIKELTPSNASLPLEKQVALRIPVNTLSDIDANLKKRTVRIPRHTWILEAIMEKLERESRGLHEQ